MNDKKVVECSIDGEQSPAFVCHHLNLNSKDCGFHEPDHGTTQKDEFEKYNGWCDRCDDFMRKNGGTWNDQTEAFARIYLICSVCFERIKNNNLIPTKTD